MNKNIDELRNAYYSSIINLHNEEDILNNLPTPDFKNFFSLIDEIIEMVEADIDVIKNNLDDEDLKEEYDHLTRCIELCIERKKEGLEITENESTEIKNNKRIVFAENLTGTFFENDLKHVEEEYYDDVLDCLQFLNDPNSINRKSEITPLQNNNRLKKVYELKLFKVRVFFKYLSNNTVYVFMTRMKKGTNDNIDVREPAERIAYLNSDFSKLEKQVRDEKIRDELIRKNNEHLNRIMEFLKENSRGEKSNGTK